MKLGDLIGGGLLGVIALSVGLLGLSLWGALGIIDRHMNRRRRWDDNDESE